MSNYSFVVPGEALTERKRQRIVKRKDGGAFIGGRTDEPDRADFKARVAFFARQACPEPLEGPIAVTITVRRCAPSSTPKKPCKSNPWPWAWWKKPDGSNFAKIIEDALTGIVWFDDAQIIDGRTVKEFWPHPEVVIEAVQVQQHYAPGNGSAAPEAQREAAE